MRISSRDFRKRITALAAVMLTAGTAVCSAQSITGGVGATNASNYAYSFVTASDGNLWLNTDYGGWRWLNLSHPSGVSISSSVGVTTRQSTPYEFIVGSDGNLWLNNDNAGAWPWTNLHTPSGVRIAGTVGATTSNGQPFGYVIGNDGNVWENNYNGSGAWVWQNAGKPPSATIARGIGVTTYSSTYPTLLVLDTTNQVWNAQWNGSTYVWTNEGSPPGGAGIAGSGGVFLVYDSADFQTNIAATIILDTNGALWALSRVIPGNYSDSGTTYWGTVPVFGNNPPSGFAKMVGIGGSNNNPAVYIYAIANNGHLFEYSIVNGVSAPSQHNGPWGWQEYDLNLSPNGVAFDLPVGAILNPWAFVTDNTGELFGFDGLNNTTTFTPLGTP